MEVSFSRIQIVFLLLLSIGISNHVLIIPHLIQATGRDAWVSIVAGYFILLLWSALLYRVLKSMRTFTFNDWLKAKSGQTGFWLIGGSLLLYFLIAGSMIIYDTSQNVNIYFLPETNRLVIILTFVLVSYFTVYAGLQTLIYVSVLLLPIVWLLGMSVSMLTMGSKDYGMIKPLMAEGFHAQLDGSIIVFGGSIDLLVLLLLQHRMKKPINYATFFIALTILVGLILGPSIGSITAFGPDQASEMRFPAFEQWRLVMVGQYISHVDYLAVFQLLAGSIVRTGLCIHLISEIIVIRSKKWRQIALITGTLVMSAPALLDISDIKMQDWIHLYFYNSSMVWGIAVTLALFAISFVKKGKGARQK
ncbi:endospore germination permease [Paenibacillus sp. GCM10027627]|uniref:endospore germination permease n=1 Tax=unclassified Paenibacillus TaxID=185978 RepID=UPI003645875A